MVTYLTFLFLNILDLIMNSEFCASAAQHIDEDVI